MHDGRAAAAPLALELNCGTMFSYRFLEGKHINLLELESLISFSRRVTREGIQARPLLVLVDSCVVLGAVSKRTIELTKDQLPASKTGVLLPRVRHRTRTGMCPLGRVWPMPPHALPKLPPPPTEVLASGHALSSWICCVSHCRRPIRQKNMDASSSPPVPSVFRK